MNRVLQFAGFLCFCLLINAFGNEIYVNHINPSCSDSQSIVEDTSIFPLQSDNNEITQNTLGKHRPVKGDKEKGIFLENPVHHVFIRFFNQTINSIWNNFYSLRTRAP